MEWKSLLPEWQAMRSDAAALVVGSGSLVMTRGERPGVPFELIWFQLSSWR